jgi:hypothetical protein
MKRLSFGVGGILSVGAMLAPYPPRPRLTWSSPLRW